MNGFHLENFLINNSITRERFGGIFHNANFTPLKNIQNNYYFIVNTVSNPNIMGHWVVFIFFRNTVYFIDSFGKNPNFYNGNIARYYENLRNSKRILLKHQIQHDESLVCGAYALYFIFFTCKGISPNSIKLKFSNKNFRKNDRIVERFLFKSSGDNKRCVSSLCPSIMFEKHCLKRCECVHCMPTM